jgi:ribonuclease HI
MKFSFVFCKMMVHCCLLEMHMFHQASLKLGMDRAVLAHARQEQEDSASSPDSGKLQLSAKEIDELLKRGAYDVFREDDTEQTEFVEADIDSILDRRSHVVNYDGSANPLSNSLGSFSKASFVSADETEDVDINDPDFWKKAVGLNNDNPSVAFDEEPIRSFEDDVATLPQQRKRKAVQMYGDSETVDDVQLNKALLAQQREWEKKEKERLRKENERERKEKERERKEAERQLRIDALAAVKAAKSAKAEKSAAEKQEKADKIAQALAQKLAQKEAQKEAQRQAQIQKQQFEAAKPSASHRVPPAQWGPHARDRVLRALSLFGFGRWHRIRRESGGGLRELKDVEEFSRFYLLLCGLLTSHEERSKSDMDFIGDSVICARLVDTLTREGELNIIIPRSLYEDKFIGKLKAGLALKTLNKLDMCTCLNLLIETAAENACRAKGVAFSDAPLDIDELVSNVTDEELAQYLPLGDLRPQWARLTSWWDRECDRHLLIGVFKHGYGKFELIRDDPNLVFAKKFAALSKLSGHGDGNNDDVNGQVREVKYELHQASDDSGYDHHRAHVPGSGFSAFQRFSLQSMSQSEDQSETITNVEDTTVGDLTPYEANTDYNDDDEDQERDGDGGETQPSETYHSSVYSFQVGEDTEQGDEEMYSPTTPMVQGEQEGDNESMDISEPVSVKMEVKSSRSIFDALVSSMSEEEKAAALLSSAYSGSLEALDSISKHDNVTMNDTSDIAGDEEVQETQEVLPPPPTTPKSTGGGRHEVVQRAKNPLPENRPFEMYEADAMPIQVTLTGNRECQVLIPVHRKSQYRGVFSQPGSCRWVTLHGDTNPTMVGCFDTELEASKAYDHEARKRDGMNAICNFDRSGARVLGVGPALIPPPMPSHRSSKFRGVRASGSKWTCQISYEVGSFVICYVVS